MNKGPGQAANRIAWSCSSAERKRHVPANMFPMLSILPSASNLRTFSGAKPPPTQRSQIPKRARALNEPICMFDVFVERWRCDFSLYCYFCGSFEASLCGTNDNRSRATRTEHLETRRPFRRRRLAERVGCGPRRWHGQCNDAESRQPGSEGKLVPATSHLVRTEELQEGGNLLFEALSLASSAAALGCALISSGQLATARSVRMTRRRIENLPG